MLVALALVHLLRGAQPAGHQRGQGGDGTGLSPGPPVLSAAVQPTFGVGLLGRLALAGRIAWAGGGAAVVAGGPGWGAGAAGPGLGGGPAGSGYDQAEFAGWKYVRQAAVPPGALHTAGLQCLGASPALPGGIGAAGRCLAGGAHVAPGRVWARYLGLRAAGPALGGAQVGCAIRVGVSGLPAAGTGFVAGLAVAVTKMRAARVRITRQILNLRSTSVKSISGTGHSLGAFLTIRLLYFYR